MATETQGVNIQELLAKMLGDTISISAGATPSLKSIFTDINKISEMSSIKTLELVSLFNSNAAKMKGFVEEAQSAMKGVFQGDFKSLGEVMSKLSKEAGSAMGYGLGEVAKVAGVFAGIAFDTINYMNQKVKQARTQQLTGVLNAMTQEPIALMKDVGGPIGKLGGAIGSIVDNAIGSLNFLYEDYMAKQLARQRGEAQLGTGRVGAIAGEMSRLMDAMGKGKAAEWTGGMAKIGVTDDANALYKSIQTGLTLQMDASEVTGALQQVMASTTNATDAANTLQESFRAMQKAAAGTGASVGELAKYTRDALANARFMNIDMKSLDSTMQFIAKSSEKMKAFGMSMKADSGNILKSFTDTSKISDAMFAYFGTKGGTEGSPIEGIIKAQFGESFQKTLRVEAGGGFTADKGKDGGNSMLVQRMEMMKNAMMEAGKSGATASDKLYLQMKTATEVFKLTPDAAKQLASSNMADIKDIAKDPALADEFKSTNKLLSEQKSFAAVNETIQRAMSQLSVQQVGLALTSVKYLDVLAMKAGGMDQTAITARFNEANEAMTGHLASMGKNLSTTFNSIMPALNKVGLGAPIKELITDLKKLTGTEENPSGGDFIFGKKPKGTFDLPTKIDTPATTTKGGVERTQSGNQIILTINGPITEEALIKQVNDLIRQYHRS